MNVTEVKDLFLAYVDESDEGGPAPNWTTMRRNLLEQGYFDFVQFICDIDDFIYRREVDITLSTTDTYDLSAAANSVRIMGNPAGGLTHQRLWRLVNVTTLDGNSKPQQIIPGTRRLDAVAPFGSSSFQLLRPWFAAQYLFKGTVLHFNIELDQSLRLFYVPSPRYDAALAVGVDWTADGTSDTTFIDDFEQFHDAIALFAARRYAIMDGQDNPQVERELMMRKNDIQMHLLKNVDASAGGRVQVTY